MAGYAQFCPVAKAMDLLDERWTLLVIRELLMGSRYFNDLRRGLPRMSPALLSTRLRSLVRAGIVERKDDGRRPAYVLTSAGRDLRPVIEALGVWGMRWVPEIGDEDLDPHLLMWDIHRNIDLAAVPPERTVVQVSFRGLAAARDWWLLIDRADVDVCETDPGLPVAAVIDTDLRTLTHVWRGELPWQQAVRSGQLHVHGPAHLRRALPGWFKLSAFASAALTA